MTNGDNSQFYFYKIFLQILASPVETKLEYLYNFETQGYDEAMAAKIATVVRLVRYKTFNIKNCINV